MLVSGQPTSDRVGGCDDTRCASVSVVMRVLATAGNISSDGGWGGRNRGVERRSSIGFSRSALWPSLSSESGLRTCRYRLSRSCFLVVSHSGIQLLFTGYPRFSPNRDTHEPRSACRLTGNREKRETDPNAVFE